MAIVRLDVIFADVFVDFGSINDIFLPRTDGDACQTPANFGEKMREVSDKHSHKRQTRKKGDARFF